MLSPLASCHVENFLFRSHSRSRYDSYGCMLLVRGEHFSSVLFILLLPKTVRVKT